MLQNSISIYVVYILAIAVYVGIEISIYNVCYQGVVLRYVHTISTVLYTTQPLMHTPPSLSLSLQYWNFIEG